MAKDADKDVTAPATQIALKDENGADIGVTLTLGGDGETVADRVTGWSRLEVDGEPYTYSKARAAALVLRFPHFRKQIEGAK